MADRRVTYADSRLRRRRRRRQLAGLLAVVLVAALGIALATRLIGRDPAPAAASPTAIVEAAAASMGVDGLTMRVTAKASFVARSSGGSSQGAMAFSGEVVAPSRMRVKGTLALPDLPKSPFEMVTVDNGATVYMRLDTVASGWQKLPADENPADTDPRADLLRSLAAATKITLVRSERFNGHECDVIELQLDVAALEKSDPGLGLATSLTDNLEMSADQIVAALDKATGKRMLWIGRNDRLVYKDQTAIKVDAGKAGTYEENEAGTFTAFGKPLSSPIEAPL